MKNSKNKKGFSLIELLVVILIIGILAAIALPKYQFAVKKSKYTKLMNIAKSIANANEIYYLYNNRYGLSLDSLDISLPNCVYEPHETWGYDQVRCRDVMFNMRKDYGFLEIFYNSENLPMYRIPYKIHHMLAGYAPNCVPRNENQKEFCLKMGARVEPADTTGLGRWGDIYYL